MITVFLKKCLIFLDRKKIIKLSDKNYVEYLYFINFKEKLNINNPKTFNEKIQCLKIFDRKNDYTNYVDKYEVKELVKKKLKDGENYIIPTIGVWDNPDDIDFDNLPDKFVLKCTHDSGSTIICKDKKTFDITSAKRKLKKCLKKDYYPIFREYAYKNVKPRIICEQYMEDKQTNEIRDYKFMCCNGKVKFLFVVCDRFTKEMHMNFYDVNWNFIPCQRMYKNSTNLIKKPNTYDEMLKLAEKLSKNIPFVRIDFYEINGKIYFGEYTFYPGTGLEKFTPKKYDKILGDLIDIESVIKESKYI